MSQVNLFGEQTLSEFLPRTHEVPKTYRLPKVKITLVRKETLTAPVNNIGSPPEVNKTLDN